MIDGCVNNNQKKPRVIGNRVSVLDRLHIKLENRKQKEQGQQQQQGEEPLKTKNSVSVKQGQPQDFHSE